MLVEGSAEGFASAAPIRELGVRVSRGRVVNPSVRDSNTG